MRKIYILLFSFVLGLFMVAQIFAQTPASAVWQLRVDTAATVVGNITAPAQIENDTLCVADYNGGAGDIIKGERVFKGSTYYWYQETAINLDRSLEFRVSPQTGNSLTVDSVYIYIGCYGTNTGMYANIYRSSNGFTSSTRLDTFQYVLLDIRTNTFTSLAYSVGAFIDAGQTFSIRVYPWYNSSNSSITKYICLRDIKITGTTTPKTGVGPAVKVSPNVFTLRQNYPNPFNPSTRISFTLAKAGYTTLTVYNLLGQKVATVLAGVLPAGTKEVNFNASNLPSGVYTYKLESGNYMEMKKMILVK
jgi:hypothetical protein